mgnify:CR=1 FL=1
MEQATEQEGSDELDLQPVAGVVPAKSPQRYVTTFVRPVRIAAIVMVPLTVGLIVYSMVTLGFGWFGVIWTAFSISLLALAGWWIGTRRQRTWIGWLAGLVGVMMIVASFIELGAPDLDDIVRLVWLVLILFIVIGVANARAFTAPHVQRPLEELLAAGESSVLEYKSTLRWDVREGRVNRALQAVIAKTVAAFLNAEGGILLIGVDDDGEVLGLESDMKTLKRTDRDGFEQTLRHILQGALGAETSGLIRTRYEDVDGLTVAVVDVSPSDAPVFVREKDRREFFVRVGNATSSLDPGATYDYINSRWKS